ncbi:MAG: divergent polysaccharide deacetylase family protein [Thioalkalispiraceae bacterium]
MLLPVHLSAASEQQHTALLPVVSIIIDDLGYRYKYGKQAVQLPARLTFAFLPHSPHAVELAELANQHQQEVMLHMPMESDESKKLGPGGLTQCMTEQKIAETIKHNFAAIPHVKGFNNHMGSLLTRSDMLMDVVMKASSKQGMYFVDSRTTSESVAIKHARDHGIHGVSRDIFLDHFKDETFIQAQLAKLVKRAKQKGSAIAIGHPYQLTLKVLEQWLPQARKLGIRLVPVSELIQIREQRRFAWQASSSPSPRAVKN